MTFSAVRGLLVRPLPFAEAERIAWVFAQDTALGVTGEPVSAEETNAVAAAAAFESMANIGARTLIRAEGDRRFEWHGLWVTASLPAVRGVTPARGRTFSADDRPRGPAPGMMLGYERWQNDFAGDPGVLGRVSVSTHGRTVSACSAGLEFPFGRTPARAPARASRRREGLSDVAGASRYPGGMTSRLLRESHAGRRGGGGAGSAGVRARRPICAGRSSPRAAARSVLGFSPALPCAGLCRVVL